MDKLEKKRKIYHLRAFWVLAILTLIVLAVWLFVYTHEGARAFFTSPDALREKIISFGNLAPAFIITYHVFQVIFAPLPGQAIDMANGYIFGLFKGSLISLTGIFLGTAIAIFLARIFGRPLLKHFLSGENLNKIDKSMGRRSLLFFFILFFIPGLPDDLLCFAAGLTKIPLWKLVLVAFAGRTPSVIGSVFLGSTGYHLNPLQFFNLTLIVLAILFLLFKLVSGNKKLKKYINDYT